MTRRPLDRPEPWILLSLTGQCSDDAPLAERMPLTWGTPGNDSTARCGQVQHPVSTILSSSERRIPAEAIEHREKPPIVNDVEQAHDLAYPSADDR